MVRYLISFVIAVAISLYALAQPPSGYYATTQGKTGEELMIALYNIIKNHESLSYSALWQAFYYTDRKPNGYVWDMYSDVPNGTPPYQYSFFSDQCGNYSNEGDCYNREHSLPASWFNDGSPMYTDLFHLYPTDGYVNNRRSNYPFGRVGNATWTSLNGGKLGQSNYPGYSGTVFEPIDEYKGDFARTYFYMVTRYYNVVQNWSSAMLSNTQFPAFSEWALNLLLEWHQNDPVSQKEVDRNNTVYSDYQGNRNPFIDRPEFATLIWVGDVEPVTINSTPLTEVYELEQYSYTITASGETGSSISISCTQKPSWMSFEQAGNGIAQLIGTPQHDDVGSHAVSITATDGITSDTQDFIVTVLSLEVPVEFISTPVYVIHAYHEYLYNVVVQGGENAEIQISCIEKPNWLNFNQTDNGTALLWGTPTSSDVGFHFLLLEATDGVTSAQQAFDIEVLPLTILFSSTPDVIAKIDEEYEYLVIAEVQENSTLTPSITCNQKPKWMSISQVGDGAALLKGTPSIDDIGTYPIELTANLGDFSNTQLFFLYVVEQDSGMIFTERFENIPESSSTYSTRSWTGDYGFEWTASSARTDEFIVNRAICLEDADEPFLVSQTLPGGISWLSFACQQKSSGSGGTISLYVNDILFGEVVNVSPSLQLIDVFDINIEDDFIIKLVSNGFTEIAIDNLTWQSFSKIDAPIVESVSYQPTILWGGDEVTVSCEVIADNQLASVTIHWGIEHNLLENTVLMLGETSQYIGSFTIPDEAQQLLFFIRAIDSYGLIGVSDIVNIEININNSPVIQYVDFYPINPSPDDIVMVRAQVVDPDGDALQVFVKWGNEQGELVNNIVLESISGYFQGAIPENLAESTVFFQVYATDPRGAEGFSLIYSYTVTGTNYVSKPEMPKISVFPNPTRGIVELFVDTLEPINIELQNIYGVMIKSFQRSSHNSKQILFDVSGMQKGVYLLRVKGKSFDEIVRLVVI